MLKYLRISFMLPILPVDTETTEGTLSFRGTNRLSLLHTAALLKLNQAPSHYAGNYVKKDKVT